MNKVKWIACALGLCVVTMGVYTVARKTLVHTGPVHPVTSVASAAGEGVPLASAPAAADGTPWTPMPDARRAAIAETQARPVAPAPDGRQQAIAHALRQMESLGDDERKDPAKVAQSIIQLRKANGSSVMGTVNLDALICNLAIAQKMKELTSTMKPQDLGASEAGDPDRAARLKEKFQQLKRLTDQLRNVAHTNSSVDTQSCGVVTDQSAQAEGQAP